jgi:hypothetical protein
MFQESFFTPIGITEMAIISMALNGNSDRMKARCSFQSVTPLSKRNDVEVFDHWSRMPSGKQS